MKSNSMASKETSNLQQSNISGNLQRRYNIDINGNLQPRYNSDISGNLQPRYNDIQQRCNDVNGRIMKKQTQSSFSLRTVSSMVVIFLIIALCYKVDMSNASSNIHFRQYFMPAIEIFFLPVDSPIFRNLVNITNSLSGQLTGLNITASSEIMQCSIKSRSLANKVYRNEKLFNGSVDVVQYLNQLGDQTFKSSEAIEKLYPTGESALKEIGMELNFIIEKIQPNQVLTWKNMLYFEKRCRMILDIITDLRDQFQKVKNEIDELYVVYNGTRHQLTNGIYDVEVFFKTFEQVFDELYDTERLKRDLSYLKRILEKVPTIQYQINYLLSEFNQYRQVLIQYCNEWIKFQRRKLVSTEDIENLKKMAQGLNSMAKIFKMKVNENVDLVIRVPNNYQPYQSYFNWGYLKWARF